MAKITAEIKLLSARFPIRWVVCAGVVSILGIFGDGNVVLAQDSATAEEIPEEVLQTQVLVEANSPLTGQAQRPEVYTQERQQLQVAVTEVPPRLDPSIYRAVELLRLRKLLKSLFPF
jgi:hypothetical protein